MVRAPFLEVRRPPVVVGVLLLLMSLMLTGCTRPWEREPAAEPSRSGSAPLNTVARAEVGDRLILTASVATVLAERAFVVRDVDLPDQGLLVLAPTETELRPPDLVAVEGTVRRFSFSDVRTEFGLGQPEPYLPYEGRKVLVATEIRNFA